MATELGKAYVQIIPSAQGIQGKIAQALGGEADNAGQSAGKSLGSKLAGTFKTVIAASGIGTAISSALNEGAALQQSIGGIETLFKTSADTIKQYASEAYKTAGLSANEYMETATGFAASLIQSCGSNTATAAEIANRAIIDMSDNANKMGTDMGLIQNAYQGFAKGNYTMLDNLKLGYGGTQEEMKRLILEASKMTDVQKELGITVDGTSMDFANVANAISVVQANLGIAGATAAEAEATFSGSMASMKAAAKNLMANLTLGEDISDEMTQLGDAVFTFVFDNLLPMIGNIVKGVPDILNSFLSAIVRGINKMGTSTDLVSSALEFVKGLAVAIVGNAPYIIESALKLIGSFIDQLLSTDWKETAKGLVDSLKGSLDLASGEILGSDDSFVPALMNAVTKKLPEVLKKGVEIVTKLANGILQNLPMIISSAGTILSKFVTFIMQNLPVILQAGVKLLGQLAQGIINNMPTIISTVARVVSNILSTFGTHLPQLLQQGIKLLGEVAAGIISAIPTLVGKIPQVIKGIKDAFFKTDWGGIGKDIIRGIAKGITNGVGLIISAAKEAANSAYKAAKKKLGIASPSKVMRDGVGKWIPAGIAVGIEKNTSMVNKAMSDLTKEASGTINADVAMGIGRNGYASLATANGGMVGGFNQTLNIYSPQQLSPSEVARQTRNATKNMVLALQGA